MFQFERRDRNLRKSSEHLQKSFLMFRSQRNTFGNRRQCSEVIGNFWKSGKYGFENHTFDLGKVGRYTVTETQTSAAW